MTLKEQFKRDAGVLTVMGMLIGGLIYTYCGFMAWAVTPDGEQFFKELNSVKIEAPYKITIEKRK